MIQIQPIIKLEHQPTCPHCGTVIQPSNILWLSMAICTEYQKCPSCNATIVEDLRVGHAALSAFQVDLEKKTLFGNVPDREPLSEPLLNFNDREWLGEALLNSLENPQSEPIKINKEILKPSKNVIILNCIDYLYGHSLLKLLNAQKHLEEQSNYGLVVIIPKFLRWMVPEGIAEIWTVDIPLKRGREYFLKFNEFVHQELKRFDEVYVSKAHSHPSKVDISNFTKIPKHNFNEEEFRVTYIWREDRIWCTSPLWSILRRINLISVALLVQNWNIQNLFKRIKTQIPTAKLTVIGLGKKTTFPEWIEDLRVEKFHEKTEIAICKVYSESRLVIGVHGSNMLLPTGHAGMTINLMPKEKWRLFASDVLYHESDPRTASFRYRYLPLEIDIPRLALIAQTMLVMLSDFKRMMNADK
jgi:hypothetical protein